MQLFNLFLLLGAAVAGIPIKGEKPCIENPKAREIATKWLDAWRSNNVNKIVEMLDENAKILFPGRDISDKEAIHSKLEQFLKGYEVKDLKEKMFVALDDGFVLMWEDSNAGGLDLVMLGDDLLITNMTSVMVPKTDGGGTTVKGETKMAVKGADKLADLGTLESCENPKARDFLDTLKSKMGNDMSKNIDVVVEMLADDAEVIYPMMITMKGKENVKKIMNKMSMVYGKMFKALDYKNDTKELKFIPLQDGFLYWEQANLTFLDDLTTKPGSKDMMKAKFNAMKNMMAKHAGGDKGMVRGKGMMKDAKKDMQNVLENFFKDLMADPDKAMSEEQLKQVQTFAATMKDEMEKDGKKQLVILKATLVKLDANGQKIAKITTFHEDGAQWESILKDLDNDKNQTSTATESDYTRSPPVTTLEPPPLDMRGKEGKGDEKEEKEEKKDDADDDNDDNDDDDR